VKNNNDDDGTRLFALDSDTKLTFVFFYILLL